MPEFRGHCVRATKETLEKSSKMIAGQERVESVPAGAEQRSGPGEEEATVSLVRESQRNPEAFVRLYDIYYSRIYNFVLRTVMNNHDAEDITSQTFLNALKGLHSFDPAKGRFTSWIYRIASNATMNHLRKQNGQPIDSQIDVDSCVLIDRSSPTPRRRLEEEQECERLFGAIARLKPKYCLNVVLFYFEEKSMREIAEITGSRVITVKWRLHHARRLMAAYLSRTEERQNE